MFIEKIGNFLRGKYFKNIYCGELNMVFFDESFVWENFR